MAKKQLIEFRCSRISMSDFRPSGNTIQVAITEKNSHFVFCRSQTESAGDRKSTRCQPQDGCHLCSQLPKGEMFALVQLQLGKDFPHIHNRGLQMNSLHQAVVERQGVFQRIGAKEGDGGSYYSSTGNTMWRLVTQNSNNTQKLPIQPSLGRARRQICLSKEVDCPVTITKKYIMR